MNDVVMITEATYPHSHGGVSVWCDQTLRGLSEYRFEVLALCATTASSVAWSMPDNVTAFRSVGLWEPLARPKSSRAEMRIFAPIFENFLDTVLNGEEPAAFVASLRQLFDLAQEGVLSSVLRNKASVDLLIDRLNALSGELGDAAPRVRVADALEILLLLVRYLMPLSVTPPRADLCHSVANGLSVLVALGAKWTTGTPFLMSEHGLYLRERFLEYAPGKSAPAVARFIPRFMRALVAAGYSVADRIAPGSLYNRTWELATGASPGKIRPIYNGVDAAAFAEVMPEPSRPTLAWLGRIDPLKDVETLIRGFSVLHESDPEVRLRLFGGVPAGNEEYAQRCRTLATELDLDDSLTFEGRVDSVSDAYGAGQIVLNTSISEGFPYAVLEAMASRRCVVATDVGGVAEAIGDAGVLVPPGDELALAAACRELLDDAGRRDALAARARERVLSCFTVDQSNDGYRSLYRELLDEQSEHLEVEGRDVADLVVSHRALEGAR